MKPEAPEARFSPTSPPQASAGSTIGELIQQTVPCGSTDGGALYDVVKNADEAGRSQTGGAPGKLRGLNPQELDLVYRNLSTYLSQQQQQQQQQPTDQGLLAMDGGGDTVEVPNLLQSTALMNMLHMQQLQQQQQGQLQLRPVLPPQMQMQGELVATLKQLHEQHLLNILSQHQGSALAAHRTGSDQQGGQPSRSQGLASHQSNTDVPKVSHSKSEKQRRDLINTMIDNLRTVVPPSLGNHGANELHHGAPRAFTEGKRTKLAVLKQAYALIEFQNQRIRDMQEENRALQDGLKQLPSRVGAFEGMLAPDSQRRAPPAEDCAASTQETKFDSTGCQKGTEGTETAALGVWDRQEPLVIVVLQSDSTVIQIQCVHRPGLHAKVLTALAALPLDVLKTFSQIDKDVFSGMLELHLQSPTLTETVLRDTVLSALANEQHDDGNKRKAARTD